MLRDKCLRQGSSRPNMALATAADGEAADAASEGAGMDAQKLQKMVERTEEVKCRRDEKLRSELCCVRSGEECWEERSIQRGGVDGDAQVLQRVTGRTEEVKCRSDKRLRGTLCEGGGGED